MQSGTETTACTAAQPSAAVAEEVAAVLGTAAQAKCTGNTADSSVKEVCAEQRRSCGGWQLATYTRTLFGGRADAHRGGQPVLRERRQRLTEDKSGGASQAPLTRQATPRTAGQGTDELQ